MSYAPIPMVPGPVSVAPEVLAVLSKDYGSGDIEPDYINLYRATASNLAKIMGTKNDVVIMTGEGMLSLWAGLKCTLTPNDKVLCLGTGIFGDGIGQMAASMGCIVKTISLPYDQTIGNLDHIAETIKEFKPTMITAVHCETPSGTLNPLAELGKLKKSLGVPLFYVDAVASIGGCPVLGDDWEIDLLLGGSQKALGAPPSLSFLSISPTAWEYITKINYQGYEALLPYKEINDTWPNYTPYWHGLAALHTATQMILAEGLEQVFARHLAVAEQCRKGLRQLGLELWPAPNAICSPTVTAVKVPQNFTWEAWNKALRQQGLVLGGNYGPLAGKVFRLGHMAKQADPKLMEQALAVIARCLAHKNS